MPYLPAYSSTVQPSNQWTCQKPTLKTVKAASFSHAGVCSVVWCTQPCLSKFWHHLLSVLSFVMCCKLPGCDCLSVCCTISTVVEYPVKGMEKNSCLTKPPQRFVEVCKNLRNAFSFLSRYRLHHLHCSYIFFGTLFSSGWFKLMLSTRGQTGSDIEIYSLWTSAQINRSHGDNNINGR